MAELGGGWAGSGSGSCDGGALRLIRVSAIANSSVSSISGASIILKASEAVTCGDKMEDQVMWSAQSEHLTPPLVAAWKPQKAQ